MTPVVFNGQTLEAGITTAQCAFDIKALKLVCVSKATNN